MMPLSLNMNMPLNLMALYGSYAIVLVMLLRLIFRHHLPKAVFPAIWVLVMVRLLIPFSISSPLSLSATILPTLKPAGTLEIRHGTSEKTMTMVPVQSSQQIDWSMIVSVLFGIGVVATIVVLILQKRYYDKKLRDCLPLTENRTVNDTLREMAMEHIPVFTCDYITTPLAHGILQPRIYMPTEMDFTQSKLVRHILLHELAHINHKHNWIKAAMLVVLCLNWYNPLVWMMGYCMGADLEGACDAAVMKQTRGNERHDYAKSLLAMSMTEKRPALLYSSFAKTAVEQRIKGVLCYRRTTAPALTISALLICTCIVVFATVWQSEFSPVLSSNHQTTSGRWRLRGDMTWNVSLGENAKERADAIMVRILAQDTTDDIELLKKQLQAALSKEFGAPMSAFTLSSQLTLSPQAVDAEYAAKGITINEGGHYIYESELVRMTDDPILGAGNTYPLGTVDLLIQRDSKGNISHIVTYHRGDALYDRNTKRFPS